MLSSMRIWTLTLSAMALVGCGMGEQGGGADRSEIHDFSMVGTDGGNTISPYQNGGIFSVFWDAESSTSPYRAELYVSADNRLDQQDRMILGRNCDQPLGDCPGKAASFNCSFDTDNIVVCPAGVAGGAATRTNISEYLGTYGLPGSYRLLLQVCNGLFEDCVGASVPVVIQ